MVRFTWVLVLGLVLSLAALPALAERRVALVMGADAYREVRPLGNAVNDAVAMQGLLESLGFEVYLETNRDLRRMRRALEDFAEDAAGADLAAVFFAGHGVEIGGRNHLLPVDASAADAASLAASALPLEEVVATLRAVAPAALVILDACRDDPFVGGGGTGRGAGSLIRPAGAPAVTPGLGRIGRADGILFAFAAAPGATAADGTGSNSPFTEAMLRYLGTEGLELRGALTLVQQEVYDRSRGVQLPYVESGLPRLVFAAAPARADLPERERLLMAMADLTPDLRAEIEAVAAARAMPLAPLFAAALTADLARAGPGERAAQLAEAAEAYAAFQADIRRFASDDPRVQALRAEAEAQVALGAFETARARLTEAAAIDAASRTSLRDNLVARSLSEAETHSLNAAAARADLRYDLALADYRSAVALFAEAAMLGGGDQAFGAQILTLSAMAGIHHLLGDLASADRALEEALRAATGWIEHVEAAGDVSVDALRNTALVVSQIAETRKERGFLEEAAEYQERALAALTEMIEYLRDAELLRHDLVVGHIRAGDIALARLQREAALASYQAAMLAVVALRRDFPDVAAYGREQSVVHNRRGDVLRETGRIQQALADYNAARGLIAVALAASPGDAGLQRDMIVTLTKTAQIAQAQGDLASAGRDFADARSRARKASSADPDNAVLRRWVAVTAFWSGDIARARGDFAAAGAAFGEGQAIMTALAARDPDNVEWQRDLASAHMRLGGLALERGDPVTAVAEHLRELAVAEALLARNPSSQLYRHDRLLARARIGGALAAAGDLEAAEARHRAVLAEARALAAEAPGDLLWQAELAMASHVLAEVLEARGFADRAFAAYAEARTIRSGLLETGAAQPGERRNFLLTSMRMIGLALESGRAGLARPLLAPALDVAGELLEETPQGDQARRDLAILQHRAGEVHAALEDGAAAMAAFDASLALRQSLTADHPGNALLWSELATTHERKGELAWARGDASAARHDLARAFEAASRGAELAPFEAVQQWALLNVIFKQAMAADQPRPFLEHALDQALWMDKQGMLGPDGAQTIGFLRGHLAGAPP